MKTTAGKRFSIQRVVLFFIEKTATREERVVERERMGVTNSRRWRRGEETSAVHPSSDRIDEKNIDDKVRF